MDRVRLAKTILLLILSLTLITGCWNRRELDTLAIISGIGLDPGKNPGEIEITTQIIKTGQLQAPAGGGGGGGQQQAFWNAMNSGTTIYQAIQNLSLQVNRHLFFPHAEIAIFNEQLAKDGIDKYLDFLLRHPEIRFELLVYISKCPAAEVLGVDPLLEQIPATYIAQLVDIRKATQAVVRADLHSLTSRLLSKTTDPVVPIIDIKEQGGQKIPHIAGTAVFKRDKMVGVLNLRETRGLLWVLGEVTGGVITVDSPKENGRVNLEIIETKSKIIPKIQDGKLIINIEIWEEGNLGSQMVLADLSSPEMLKSLESRKAAAIKNEILAAVNKAQSLNTDIFGFGEAVHRKYRKEWKEMEQHWDDLFPTLDVRVTVDANIRRVGLTTKPAKP